jgi:hypothetical protein
VVVLVRTKAGVLDDDNVDVAMALSKAGMPNDIDVR